MNARVEFAATRKWTALAGAAALAALAGACGSGASVGRSDGGTHPLGIPPPGIVGRYVEHDSARPHRLVGIAGVRIVLYRGRVQQGGPEIAPPEGPKPLARTVTGAGGRFWFRHVRPRRYFVMAFGHGFSPGRFVRVTSTTATEQVRIIGCSDCPRPLVAAGAP